MNKNLKDCSEKTRRWYKENCRSQLNQYSIANDISFAIAQRLILYLVNEIAEYLKSPPIGVDFFEWFCNLLILLKESKKSLPIEVDFFALTVC